MPKKVYVDGQGVVTAADLNALETLRFDVFDEATTKPSARAAIGAVTADHPHPAAVPSVNGFGGSAGFLSATNAEKLQQITSYPQQSTQLITDNHVIRIIAPTGEIYGATIADLKAIFGSGGGTTPPPITDINAGGAENNTTEIIDCGGSTTTVVTTFDAGQVIP